MALSCYTTRLPSNGREKRAHRKVSALKGLRKHVNVSEQPNLVSQRQAQAEAVCGAPCQATPAQGPSDPHAP